MNEKTRHNYEIDFILTRNNKIGKRIFIGSVFKRL